MGTPDLPVDDPEFTKAAELLLETGVYTPGYDRKALYFAMQGLLDYDPWMDEPWTEEELKAIAESEEAVGRGEGVVW